MEEYVYNAKEHYEKYYCARAAAEQLTKRGLTSAVLRKVADILDDPGLANTEVYDSVSSSVYDVDHKGEITSPEAALQWLREANSSYWE